MKPQLGRQMAAGAAWMVAMRLSITALGVGSTIVLARILIPADFGLVALATSMIAALEILTSFRLDAVLIQNRLATRAEYDSAWSLNLIFSTLLGTLVCLAATRAAHFFHEPRLAAVMLVLGASTFVGGLENIGIVNFRKDLDFGREFAYSLSRKIAGVCVGVSSAVMFGSYWALVAGIVAGSATGVAASYLMQPYRPRWSLVSARGLFQFSKWLMVDNALYFLRHRSVDFLIGKIAGPGALGLFSLAYELGTMANANLAAPIERAMFPGYARMAAGPDTLQAGYLSVSGLTALLIVPVAVGIAAIAPLLIPVLFGAKWLTSIPLLQVVGVAASISLLDSGASSICLILGRPRLLVCVSGSYVIVLLLSLALLLPHYGALGAAWSFAIAAGVSLPVQLGLLRWALKLTIHRWIAAVWRAIAAAVAMHLIVSTLLSRLAPAENTVSQALQLLAAVASGVLCYVAIVMLLWFISGRPEGAESAVLRYIGLRDEPARRP
jgi:O-antigen/teichoic acid export membrane protein